jgi:hypothetical protein
MVNYESLLNLHQLAPSVDIATVEQLGPHDNACYKLGKLLITSVSLSDSGLRSVG